MQNHENVTYMKNEITIAGKRFRCVVHNVQISFATKARKSLFLTHLKSGLFANPSKRHYSIVAEPHKSQRANTRRASDHMTHKMAAPVIAAL